MEKKSKARLKAEPLINNSLHPGSRLQKIFNDIQDLIMILEPGLKIINANQAVARFFGKGADKIKGEYCHKMMHNAEEPPPECPVTKMLISKKREEAVLFLPNKNIWADITADPIFNTQGELTGIIHIIRDITELKNSEKKQLETEKELRSSYQKLKKIFNQTINALVVTLGLRDPYTSSHQQRVTQLSCAIAREMGLSEEQIEGLRVAGMLHDIGKIYIPAEILAKPAQLTPEELTLMQTHVRGSYDIIKEIDFPWPVADIVLQHHEKCDGSGYPEGLKGEQMLMESKILAVADVVEAMASHRPYRPARGITAALEEITLNQGILFDPLVVKACIKLFQQHKFVFSS